jgi:hypothetical protein
MPTSSTRAKTTHARDERSLKRQANFGHPPTNRNSPLSGRCSSARAGSCLRARSRRWRRLALGLATIAALALAMGLLAALALATIADLALADLALAFGGLARGLALAFASAAHHRTSTEEFAGQADSEPTL